MSSALQLQLLSLAQDGQHQRLQQALQEEEQINLDFADQTGLSPLMYGARADHAETVSALLDGGADVNFQSPLDGRTALHVAAFHGSLDAIDVLVSRGADATLRDQQGRTPLEQEEVDGESSSDVHAVRSAIENALAARDHPLHMDDDDDAQQQEDEEQGDEQEHATDEQEHEQDQEAEADDAEAEEHRGTEEEEEEEEEEHEGDGGDDSANDADEMLHSACASGDVSRAALALDSGADADRPDAAGLTPLMVAARAGHLPLVRLLVEEAAADRDAQHESSERMSALMFAVQHGHVECVAWMIRHGACAVSGPRNAAGQTADTIEPLERVSHEEMQSVIAQAIADAQQDARQQQQTQQGRQHDDQEHDGHDDGDGGALADELSLHARLAADEQKYLDQLARDQSAHRAQQARSAFSASDTRAFVELPVGQAMGLLVQRYNQICADCSQDPSAFILSALAHMPSNGALLLSGTSAATAGSGAGSSSGGSGVGNGHGAGASSLSSRLDDRAVFPLFEVLSQGFSNCPLTVLDLSFNRVGSLGVQTLAPFLARTRTLHTLNLEANDVDPAGGEILAEVLEGASASASDGPDGSDGSHSSLRCLNLAGNALGPRALVRWARLLASNRTLVELNLSNTGCDQAALMALATALQSNRTLKRLQLDAPLLHSLGEESAVHLARCLAVNVGLTSLSLKSHALTDSGAAWLAEFLAPNQCLTELDLRRNRLSATGAAAFVPALARRRVECRVLLDANLLRGQTFDEIHEAIALQKSQGAPNTLVWTAVQGKHSLRAKAPL